MPVVSQRQGGLDGENRMNGAPCKRAQEVLIGGRFRIQERLGGGAFGEVYKGIEVNTGRPVAMKMELSKGGMRSQLILEHRIYKRVNECPVTVGIPQSFFCGKVGDYSVMVMDLLGPCLEDLMGACHHKFKPKTVCMIGIQIIQRLQYLHNVGYLHRDIKPENFVMGLGKTSHVVYIIDVGLAKSWRDAMGQHIAYAEGRSLTGTARYVSVNTHQGIQQSRRDDLESVGYLLAYFIRGNLPWQGLKSPKKDVRFERIRDVKLGTPPAELFKGCPHQFVKYLEYTRALQYESEPDYAYCISLFSKALADMNEPFDYRYHWLEHIDLEVSSEARSSVASHRPSVGASGVAVGGSSFVASSAVVGESTANEGSKSQLNSTFIEEIQDVYGLNDYF